MLRSLELFGFKSFADKTVFEFSNGITGVVGPNGSGKSNVVDSIKWILGDQSAKSLRGKEMTDVIFNGSVGRGGAQFAEATLVFDNTSRFLPMDVDEVSVGRRLWQSGDSEYLINRHSARLKDVRELFTGTGAGATAYCIIEQGRVDQILQSNAANRRSIFEEAAGISRFKARRTEALKRLERVEQNLVRLTDIVDEVDSQVSNIRSQAQRAARYREVSTELELLWVGQAADDYRRESVRRDQLLQNRDSAAAGVTELRTRQTEAASQVQIVDARLTEVDDALRSVETARSDLRSRIASLQTTIRHQIARDAELQSDLQRLQRQSVLMTNRLGEAVVEEQHLRKVFTLEEQAIETRKASLTRGDGQFLTVQESVVTLRARLEGIRERILQQARDNSQTAADVGAHRSRLEAAQRRSLDLNHQLERMTGQLSQLCLALEACRQDLNDCQAELLSRQNLADQILHSRDGLVVEQTSSRQSLSELREHRSAMLARRAVLEDLEDRQEGFGIGVREILRRAEEAGSEPWDQICGSVADLLDVDMDNAALLEVALSGRAQLLVVRNLRPLLEYLNTGRCRINGRVGFVSLEQAQRHAGDPGSVSGSQYSADARRRGADDLALNPGTMPADDDFSTSWWSTPVMSTAHDMDLSSGLDDPLAMPGETLQPPGLEVTWVDPRTESPVVRSVFMQGPDVPTSLFGQTGVVGRADGLARSPRTMPWLASSLLADTWVVQTLDDAMRLHLASKGRFRFVTLQGELIEADGTLYAGTLRNESAVLSRKSEMRRLRNELTRLDHEIAQRELNITTLTDNIQTADTELESARRTVHEASNRVRQAESRIVDREHSITETETQQ
ncbi:MAG: AAA family ATPase, partial [Planctomycetaceae bacterium]|nr:AAA family ATPase [Planctomycetaceae bacterium]